MSTSAIDVLNRALNEQTEKLKVMEVEYEAKIRAGQEAERIVADQHGRVEELRAAIDVLRAHEKAQDPEPEPEPEPTPEPEPEPEPTPEPEPDPEPGPEPEPDEGEGEDDTL